jgi:hypothetical protein
MHPIPLDARMVVFGAWPRAVLCQPKMARSGLDAAQQLAARGPNGKKARLKAKC